MIRLPLLVFVCIPVFLNYKMFVTAKSKQANDIIVLGSGASGETEKYKRFVSFKRISTCMLLGGSLYLYLFLSINCLFWFMLEVGNFVMPAKTVFVACALG